MFAHRGFANCSVEVSQCYQLLGSLIKVKEFHRERESDCESLARLSHRILRKCGHKVLRVVHPEHTSSNVFERCLAAPLRSNVRMYVCM